MNEETISVQVQDQLLQKIVDARVSASLKQILPPALIDHLAAVATSGASAPVLSDRQRLAHATTIWRNNGWLDPSHAMRYDRQERESHRVQLPQLIKSINDSAGLARDAIKASGQRLDDFQMPTDASLLLPQVVTTVIREAVEPFLTLTPLMRRIAFSAGESITFPAVGGFTAEDLAPGQEYPERSLDIAGTVTAKIGKVGVAVRFTDEMLRFSMFDVMTLHLQAAARAMARLKEEKAADLIKSQGVPIFDNDGGASERGFTTGRDINGDGNGAITLQDMFQMFADLLNAGFVPNTLLMNPMGWLVFAQNETLRSFGFANNGPLWGAMQGAVGQAPTFAQGGVNMSAAGNPAASATPDGSQAPNATLQSPVPSLFPAPLSIVVSPFIDFDSTTQSTDIHMVDRNELGILVEDEPLVTESWDEPTRDMTKTKMRERYAFAIDNEGHSIATALGVRIARGFDWDNPRITQDVPDTGLPPITGGF